MTFQITQEETFQGRVTIETVDQKGRTHKSVVVATYKRFDEDGLAELDSRKNADVCREALINVEGLVDDNKNPIPYEGDFKEALLRIPPATFALAAYFWQASRMGRAKN